MKHFDFRFVLILAGSILFWNCQNSIQYKKETANEKQKTLEVITEYDSITAASYGADEYGMKKNGMDLLL